MDGRKCFTSQGFHFSSRCPARGSIISARGSVDCSVRGAAEMPSETAIEAREEKKVVVPKRAQRG
jgi:hypothetical protein